MTNFDHDNLSLSRRTLLTVVSMVGGAVMVIGTLSIVTVLVLSRGVGGGSASGTTDTVDVAPSAASTSEATGRRGVARPSAPRNSTHGTPNGDPGTQI